MSNIHLVMQGKGGVGKSFVSFVLAQYFKEKKRKTLLIDTDPSNQTFSLVKSLDVIVHKITSNDDVDQRKFDTLIDLFTSATKTEPDVPIDDIVVDCGTSGLVSFRKYMITMQAIPLLQDMGHRVILHIPIVGGSDANETLGGFIRLSNDFPDASLVVWLNHYLHGEVSFAGKSLKDSDALKKMSDRLLGVVDLHERNGQLDKIDLRDLMSSHLTFDEAVKSPKFMLMSRQRLKIIWRDLRSSLDQTRLLEPTEQEEQG